VDAIARPLAALLGAELLVFPAGHFLPLEAPGPVAAALAAQKPPPAPRTIREER
jgi:pimeloyl-ACP methyl ester carboxylesterase